MAGHKKSKRRSDGRRSKRKSPESLFLCGSSMLSGGMLCESSDLEVLACADTVEDIIPKNGISRFIKSRYETQSLPSAYSNDSYEDSTLNTHGNTMDQTYDGSVEITAIACIKPKKTMPEKVSNSRGKRHELLIPSEIHPHDSTVATRSGSNPQSHDSSSERFAFAPWDENETDANKNKSTDDQTTHKSKLGIERSPSSEKDDRSQMTRNTVNTDDSPGIGGVKNAESVEVIGRVIRKPKTDSRSHIGLAKSKSKTPSADDLQRKGSQQKEMKATFVNKIKEKNHNRIVKMKAPAAAWMNTIRQSMNSLRISKTKRKGASTYGRM